jgi:hypothetical protein
MPSYQIVILHNNCSLANSTSNNKKAIQKVRQAKWVLRSVQEEKPLGVEPRAGIVLEDA